MFGQTYVVDSIYHQNQYRYYGTYKPASYTGTTPWPVVLTLHGGGGNALGTIGFTQMSLVADTANFLVVYPQGSKIGSNCCSWGAGVGSPSDTAGINDISFFNKLIDSLKTEFNIDTNRIYSTGLSQGGFMSQKLACQLSHRIAAIAPLCSNLDSLQMLTCNPSRSVPVLIINGTTDILVPYNGAKFTNNGWPLTYFPVDTLMKFWNTKNGCNPTSSSFNFPDIDPTESSTITRYTWTGCSCNTETILYKVNGGGHTWPGVENVSYEIIAGQTNEDIHASVHIWQFFKKHSLLCPTTTSISEGQQLINSIRVYPNPAKNIITIESSNQKIYLTNLDIYNSLGQKMLNAQFKDNVLTIDITYFPSGLYFITTDNVKMKFIKD